MLGSRTTRHVPRRWARLARVRAVERFPEDRCTERTEEVYRFCARTLRRRARRAAPRPLERGRGEQREQEVPRRRGSASSRRTPTRERLVAEEAEHEHEEAARHETAARDREQVERDHVQRLDRRCAACRRALLPAVVRRRRHRRRARAARRLRHELRLLARVVAPELADLVAGRRASARTRRPHVAAAVSQVGGLLGPRRRARELGHVVDPVAARERVVGVQVVRLPERARVGRDREAADLDLVADDPRAITSTAPATTTTAATAARRPGSPPEQVAREDERQEQEACVREDREPATAPSASRAAGACGAARRRAPAARSPRRAAGRGSRG